MSHRSFINYLFQKIPLNCYCCGQKADNQYNLCIQCQRYLLTRPQYSYHCYQCGANIQEENPYARCGQCIKQSPAMDHLIFVNHYTGLLRQLIVQFKFNQKHCLQPILADLLAQTIIKESQQPSVIIPVPLHKKKFNQRGFNQAYILSQLLSQHLQIPCLAKACQRIRNTQPQSELSGKKRYQNVKNAFTVNQPIAHRHIALVDDVVTTGHTVNALSQTIKQQTSVESITVWCLARGEFNQQ